MKTKEEIIVDIDKLFNDIPMDKVIIDLRNKIIQYLNTL